jgi:hypothetical protein
MEVQKREFTGVWIPKEIIENERLTMLQKMLYAEIASFNVCFMLNKTLSERYGVAEMTISRSISALKKEGLIIELSFDGRQRKVQALHIYAMQTIQKRLGRVSKNVEVEYTKTSNIDNNIDNSKKTYIAGEPASSPLVPEVIKAMESIDPKNKMYYGNKTQRAAAEFLISTYGFENVINMIRAIPELKSRVAYMPSITTPCELRDKWQKVGDAIGREKVKSNNAEQVLW